MKRLFVLGFIFSLCTLGFSQNWGTGKMENSYVITYEHSSVQKPVLQEQIESFFTIFSYSQAISDTFQISGRSDEELSLYMDSIAGKLGHIGNSTFIYKKQVLTYYVKIQAKVIYATGSYSLEFVPLGILDSLPQTNLTQTWSEMLSDEDMPLSYLKAIELTVKDMFAAQNTYLGGILSQLPVDIHWEDNKTRFTAKIPMPSNNKFNSLVYISDREVLKSWTPDIKYLAQKHLGVDTVYEGFSTMQSVKITHGKYVVFFRISVLNNAKEVELAIDAYKGNMLKRLPTSNKAVYDALFVKSSDFFNEIIQSLTTKYPKPSFGSSDWSKIEGIGLDKVKTFQSVYFHRIDKDKFLTIFNIVLKSYYTQLLDIENFDSSLSEKEMLGKFGASLEIKVAETIVTTQVVQNIKKRDKILY
jgi:hypothetical protein